MRKSNFTENEITKITNFVANFMNVRINKAGNIAINFNGNKDQYVLRYSPGGLLWKHTDGYYSYLLNMRNRKNVTKQIYEFAGGKYENDYYNIYKNCTFKTFDEALEYFKNYLKKYKNIEL